MLMGDDSRDFLIIYVDKFGRKDLKCYGYEPIKNIGMDIYEIDPRDLDRIVEHLEARGIFWKMGKSNE